MLSQDRLSTFADWERCHADRARTKLLFLGYPSPFIERAIIGEEIGKIRVQGPFLSAPTITPESVDCEGGSHGWILVAGEAPVGL